MTQTTRTETTRTAIEGAPTMLALPAPQYRYSTREEWMLAAIDEMRELFSAHAGVKIPAVKVSVGWPGGPGNKNSVIGQCWHKDAAADGVSQLFISPVLDVPVRILDVLAHELVHAVDENESGHRGRFVTIANAIGLAGKPTATVAGPFLFRHLAEIAARLGAYPHARINYSGETFHGPAAGPSGRPSDTPKKQAARQLLTICSVDGGEGYKARISRKWLDEFGAPICPCHMARMIEA